MRLILVRYLQIRPSLSQQRLPVHWKEGKFPRRGVLFMSECFKMSSHLSLLNRKNDDYKEISVPAGKSHEVCLAI